MGELPTPGRGGIPPIERWDYRKHVLSTRSFPGTSILRGRKSLKSNHKCSCDKVNEVHQSLFDFNRTVLTHSMKDELPIPEVKVCWNAMSLFEDKLPREYIHSEKRSLFSDLTRVGEAHHVLLMGTYWFARCANPKDSAGNYSRTGMAILRLLAGLERFSGPETIPQLCGMKIQRGAVNKLRNILATIDGLLMQLILSFPDRREFQNWSRVDQIVNCMLCSMLPDQFADPTDLSRITTFEKVKKLRKGVKEAGFNPIRTLSSVDIPREMSFFEPLLGVIGNSKSPMDMFKISILSQTRASGVPPRVVFLKTLEKIKKVLQEPQDPSVYEGIAGLIQQGVDEVHNKVLDKLGSETQKEKFWRHCLDKAKVSLSDSGEFFTKSSDGGKLESARKVLSGLKEGKTPRYNLVTGQIEGEVHATSQGEALFHWALDQFADDELCYERNLMSVRISLVAELGKYRGITVSHLAHAVLLHVLSHVLLEYLRVIPSSESGVGAANHAWNFFKRLSHKNPHANFIFGDKEIYAYSTDWEQATDYCDHTVAQAMINRLCFNLGIPDWYRQTCMFALCAPRQVEFMDDNNVLDVFYTTRGELMGDPVVKVILHLYHLVGRFAAEEQLQQTISAGCFETPDGRKSGTPTGANAER